MRPHDSKGVPLLYDSEIVALKGIRLALMSKHSFKGVKTVDQEDAVKRTFELEAANRCAEIGLVVSVQWDPDCSDDPEDMTLFWNPRLIVNDRTDKIGEYDHDRQKHEIRSGILDGKVGVIDPNTGELKEEPKKKLIY